MLKDLIIYTPMYVSAFWAVLLLASYTQKNKTKFLLGLFMVLAFMVYFCHALFFSHKHYNYSTFGPIYTFASLSVYPFYYWYIKTLTIDTGYKLHNLRLLLPAVVFSVAELAIYKMMGPQEKANFMAVCIYHNKPIGSSSFLFKLQKYVYLSGRVVFTLQVLVFFILGRGLVIKYNQRIANFYSDLESKSLDWVKLLLFLIIIASVASSVLNIVGRSFFANSTYLLLVPSTLFSLLLFFIGYQGYMQNHTVVDLEKDNENLPGLNMKEYTQKQLKEELIILFVAQQIYKQNDLKITQVSMLLHTNRTYISNLINNDFGCTFNEFVNKYRIEEAKRLLKDKALNNYSLNYIAELSGFGSLNTFIRIFKDFEKTTPGRFRDRHKLSG